MHRAKMDYRREQRWGTRVYLWRIHVNIWQNQYDIVKLKNKIKLKKKKRKENSIQPITGVGERAQYIFAEKVNN